MFALALVVLVAGVFFAAGAFLVAVLALVTLVADDAFLVAGAFFVAVVDAAAFLGAAAFAAGLSPAGSGLASFTGPDAPKIVSMDSDDDVGAMRSRHDMHIDKMTV